MEWFLEEKSISARIQTEGGIEIVLHFVDNDVAHTNGVTNGSATQAFEFLIASNNGLSHLGNVNRYIKAEIAITECVDAIAIV